ncbi:MAG TPA: TadE family type IV pilus minor pilin [Actinopolymorphaceae bacterium]
MRAERGMVTVEMAMAMTALCIVAAAMAWMVSIAGIQARCVDAARDAARALARGETAEVGRQVGLRSAPDGAEIVLQTRGGVAEVTVRVNARPRLPALRMLPSIPVSARAVITVEWSTVADEATAH